MDIIIIIAAVVATIIGRVSSNAKKAAEEAKREVQDQTSVPPTMPDILMRDIGKWFDDEFSGEGSNPKEQKPEPEILIKPQPKVPAPVQNAVVAPTVKATVDNSHEGLDVTAKTRIRTTVAKRPPELESKSIDVAGMDISFDSDSVLSAVIYSEILSKPKALR